MGKIRKIVSAVTLGTFGKAPEKGRSPLAPPHDKTTFDAVFENRIPDKSPHAYIANGLVKWKEADDLTIRGLGRALDALHDSKGTAHPDREFLAMCHDLVRKNVYSENLGIEIAVNGTEGNTGKPLPSGLTVKEGIEYDVAYININTKEEYVGKPSEAHAGGEDVDPTIPPHFELALKMEQIYKRLNDKNHDKKMNKPSRQYENYFFKGSLQKGGHLHEVYKANGYEAPRSYSSTEGRLPYKFNYEEFYQTFLEGNFQRQEQASHRSQVDDVRNKESIFNAWITEQREIVQKILASQSTNASTSLAATTSSAFLDDVSERENILVRTPSTPIRARENARYEGRKASIAKDANEAYYFIYNEQMDRSDSFHPTEVRSLNLQGASYTDPSMIAYVLDVVAQRQRSSGNRDFVNFKPLNDGKLNLSINASRPRAAHVRRGSGAQVNNYQDVISKVAHLGRS